MPTQTLTCWCRKSIAFAALLTAFAAQAAPLVVVPPGLNPGDEYRLAFLTQGWTSGSASTTPGTGIRDALSTDINDYNTWVTSYAEHEPILDNLGTTWTAIASTQTVDARDNTGTNPNVEIGVAIYRIDGTRIAANNIDLWDGDIEVPLSFGERGHNSFGGVWTGTSFDGTGALGFELGNAISGRSNRAYSGNSDSSWMHDTDINSPGISPEENRQFAKMYVMSDVLTVPAAVPLPAGLWLFGSALMGLAGIRLKQK